MKRLVVVAVLTALLALATAAPAFASVNGNGWEAGDGQPPPAEPGEPTTKNRTTLEYTLDILRRLNAEEAEKRINEQWGF